MLDVTIVRCLNCFLLLIWISAKKWHTIHYNIFIIYFWKYFSIVLNKIFLFLNFIIFLHLKLSTILYWISSQHKFSGIMTHNCALQYWCFTISRIFTFFNARASDIFDQLFYSQFLNEFSKNEAFFRFVVSPLHSFTIL